MPVSYAIDADKRTLRTKCFGRLTLAEVVDHFQKLELDPECPDRIDVFLDLSEVDSLPEPAQMPEVIAHLGKASGRIRFGACAIVAARDALFGMMRMFEAMGAEYFRVTRTFRASSEADAWLASQARPAPKSRGAED